MGWVALSLAGCQLAKPAAPGSPNATPVPTRSLPHQQAATITLEATPKGIRVQPPWEPAELWRGHSALEFLGREVRVSLPTGPSSLDWPVPDGSTLHYVAKSPDGLIAAATIVTPAVTLPQVAQPRLVVDKLHYTLSVMDGDTVVKTYRIALGGDPVSPKICQDNKTTPEGLYTVYNLQPEASFHRAYDVDYPSPVDVLRHKIARDVGLVPSDRDTGGEIQIHGCGSLANWTAGCMALDNEDIDELFAHEELAAGMEVFICGSVIKPDDRPWLLQPPANKVREVQAALAQAGFYDGPIDGQLGSSTQEALGRYQVVKDLPLTCQLDTATRKHFRL